MYIYMYNVYTFTGHSSIFAVVAVVLAPPIEGTLADRVLQASTLNVVHPYRPTALAKLCLVRGTRRPTIAQLMTHNLAEGTK